MRSPQADLRPGRLPTDILHMCGTPEDAPQTTTTYIHRVPNRNPCQTQGLPTSRITTREVPHPQNYDHLHQQNYDQYVLPASRITTRELASWLAGWLGGLPPGNLSCAWLAGGLAGWLRPREAQRGPERRSVDRTSLSCAWHTYTHTHIHTYIMSLGTFREIHPYIHT